MNNDHQPWQPRNNYRLGDRALVTWDGREVLLTCEEPGESGASPPQLPKISAKGCQDESDPPLLRDGTVKCSYMVR
jgi:hypothetical protein